MSFHVYSCGHFHHQHELDQAKKVLDHLKSLYQDSSDYCYCLLNSEFRNKDQSISGQYDIVVFTRNSMSVLELKAKNGKLLGKIESNYGNDDIRIEYPNGKYDSIRIKQLEEQKKHLLERIHNEFRKVMDKSATEHYRIDGYFVFNDPLDTSDFEIVDSQIKKWLQITTIDNFEKTWQKTNRKQPFTLTQTDILYLLEQKFRAQEICNVDYLSTLITPLEQIERFLTIQNNDYPLEHSLDRFKQILLSYLTNEELSELLSIMNSLSMAEEKERKRYRELLFKIDLKYISFHLIEEYFERYLFSLIAKNTKRYVDIFSNINSIYQDHTIDEVERKRKMGEIYQGLYFNAFQNDTMNNSLIFNEYNDFLCLKQRIENDKKGERDFLPIEKSLFFLMTLHNDKKD